MSQAARTGMVGEAEKRAGFSTSSMEDVAFLVAMGVRLAGTTETAGSKNRDKRILVFWFAEPERCRRLLAALKLKNDDNPEIAAIRRYQGAMIDVRDVIHDWERAQRGQ